MYREVTFANNLMDFITGFNITVETIKEIFPELSYKLDNLFYDAKSYAEAYLSKQGFILSFLFGWGYVGGVDKCKKVGGIKPE